MCTHLLEVVVLTMLVSGLLAVFDNMIEWLFNFYLDGIGVCLVVPSLFQRTKLVCISLNIIKSEFFFLFRNRDGFLFQDFVMKKKKTRILQDRVLQGKEEKGKGNTGLYKRGTEKVYIYYYILNIKSNMKRKVTSRRN